MQDLITPRWLMAGKNDDSGSKPPQKRDNRQVPKPPEENNWTRYSKVILTWLLVLVLVFAAISMFNPKTDIPSISYSMYEKLLTGQVKTLDDTEVKIVKAVIKKSNLNDYELHGTLNSSIPLMTKEGKSVSNAEFVVTLGAVDPSVQQQWIDREIEVTFEEKDSLWTQTLIGFLPWILIIGVWLFFMRRMQGGGGAGGQKGLFSFGKSRAKMINENSITVNFSDVAGADEAKYELQEVIEFLKEPGKFQRLGGKIPRGVLLLGPPGTGKTLLARAVAGEAGVPFFSISGAEFVEMFVGVGASRVRDLFENAKKNSPCIVFIDEIDAVGRQRGAGLGGGHDEREQTLNQLLVEMDGFEQGTTVIIIAATNRPDVLDPALLRPGRFDRQIVVDRPDVKGRLGILKVHTRKVPLDPDVDLEVLAKGTPGLAGADLANLVNESALYAARRNMKAVTMRDFEEAKDKIMMGMERKSLIISDEEKRMTAYHEAGHVLVAMMIPEADPVHKVTIIPRGRALGVTTYLPIDEKHTYSKPYLEAMIAYAMGGRAAELLIFGQLTTGAGNDIERATSLARKMVCEWGMSELGPMTFGAKKEEIFLGREISQHRDYSEQTAISIDESVRVIVLRGMQRAEELLLEHRETLDRLSEALLEREILDSDEIDHVLRGEALPPRKIYDDVNVGGDARKEGEQRLRIDQERSDKIRKAVEEIQRQEEGNKETGKGV
ncbi:MAG: ATP-dependent zinc metalloprotease FtsH [Bacteroidota bacterium]